MNPRRAIYPGSFDPITLGHVDVARRAARLFEEVIIAVYEGQEKPGALFSVPERAALAREVIARYQNQTFALTAFPV